MTSTTSCDLVGSIWEGVHEHNSPYRWAAITLVLSIVVVFATSSFSQNYSQVDKLWSILPVIYTWLTVCSTQTLLMACLATIWGIRLTYNFYRRGGYHWPPWQGDEDYRWKIIMEGGVHPIFQHPVVWTLFNFIFISVYQNVLLFWMAAPSFVVYTKTVTCETQEPLAFTDVLLSALFLTFCLIESIADHQQYVFQTEKHRLRASGTTSRTGEYADGFRQTGLFAIVRKPNYASEQAIWITYALFTGNVNWSWLGALQLVLLFQGTGWFTEKISRSKYPTYADYQRRVPLYVPNPFYRKAKAS